MPPTDEAIHISFWDLNVPAADGPALEFSAHRGDHYADEEQTLFNVTLPEDKSASAVVRVKHSTATLFLTNALSYLPKDSTERQRILNRLEDILNDEYGPEGGPA